jgi:YfiH family protein
MPDLRRASNLQSLRGIAHGYFGRVGGVSKGIYESLNCGPGSSDAHDNVVENRRRAREALAPGSALVTLHQIHSATAVRVSAPWPIGGALHADAMTTNVPGIALGILAADCAPVLFADEKAAVIGAAHAGWKGARAGVVEAAIAEMEALGARRERIAAAIGPCISQENYEVGTEFRAAFVEESPDDARFFAMGVRENHYQFDLESYVARRLADAGLSRIERLATCTYANQGEFFSFRRNTHRGEKDYGRQLSAIVLSK